MIEVCHLAFDLGRLSPERPACLSDTGVASAAGAPMSLLGGLAASAPAAGGYDMPEGYVAGSLDEPHQLRELRASGAAVLVTVECASAALPLGCLSASPPGRANASWRAARAARGRG